MSTASFISFDTSAPPPGEFVMPWGKYRGQTLSAANDDRYFQWLLDNTDIATVPHKQDVANAIGDYLATRKTALKRADNNTVPSQHDELTMDMAMMIVEFGAEALKEQMGLDARFGAAIEFLKGKIVNEPIQGIEQVF